MKRGFVLMEAIVVITVLCVVLIMLYSAYSKILVDVRKKSLYDNTEYIYKTSIIRRHLEQKFYEDGYDYSRSVLDVYCNEVTNPCYDANLTDNATNYENSLFKFFKVKAIYITIWDTNNIGSDDLRACEATTQNYIKVLDPTIEEGIFRIIVMFESENNSNPDIPVYEYATLRFGSRE